MLRRVIARSFSLPILASSAVHATDMRDDRQVCPRGTPHPLHDCGAGSLPCCDMVGTAQLLNPFGFLARSAAGLFLSVHKVLRNHHLLPPCPCYGCPFHYPEYPCWQR